MFAVSACMCVYANDLYVNILYICKEHAPGAHEWECACVRQTNMQTVDAKANTPPHTHEHPTSLLHT
ncbi:hypothetical protein EON63_23195 [archaeon]|nr:MAG: hypothetical protein EON63_23195 [archaeon]